MDDKQGLTGLGEGGGGSELGGREEAILPYVI